MQVGDQEARRITDDQRASQAWNYRVSFAFLNQPNERPEGQMYAYEKNDEDDRASLASAQQEIQRRMKTNRIDNSLFVPICSRLRR